MTSSHRSPSAGVTTRRRTLPTLVAVVAFMASSCSSAPSITEANAPTATVTGPPVEWVGFDLVGERGGPGGTPTTSETVTTAPASPTVDSAPTPVTTPTTTDVFVAPATPTTTDVFVAPATRSALSVAPTTTGPRPRTTTAPITVRPIVAPTAASSAPSAVTVPLPTARPPTTATPTTPPATTPPVTPAPTTAAAVPPATTPPVTPAPTTATAVPPASAPVATVASPTSAVRAATGASEPLAVAGAACRRNQLGQQRRTKDGSTVQCESVARRRRWVPATTVAPPTTAIRAPTLGPGFDGSTIRVGLLTTTTHPVWGTIGRAISAGIEARVAAINRGGGIAGRYRIVIVKAETNYDPAETLNQIQATKAGVTLYVSLLGTPSTEAAEPVLRNEGLVASPASQEARWATSPTLLPVFNSYQVQAINGIAYFAEQFALSNPGVRPVVCAVSVGTSFGDAGTEGVRAAAAALPVTLGPIVTLAPSENSFAPAVGALKAGGCQATFLTVTPLQTLGMVVTGRQLALSNRWIIMGASFSDRIVTPQTGPLFEQGAWVVGDGTQWGDESVPGMTQMKAELLASDNRFWTENPDVGLSFGWAQARTIEQVLETAASRGDLSRAGILAASRATGPVALGGIGSTIDYSQPVRLANAKTTIFNVDNSYRNAIKVLARDYGSPAAAAYRR